MHASVRPSVTGTVRCTLGWAASPQVFLGDAHLRRGLGVGCVGLWNASVTFAAWASGVGGPSPRYPGAAGGTIIELNTGSSVDTFTDTVPNGTFSFTGLPAGIAVSGDPHADTSTAVPGPTPASA